MVVRPLDHRLEHVREVVGRVAIGVQPLGRQELAARALVLPTRLEPSEKSPVDVVDVHGGGIDTKPPGDESAGRSGILPPCAPALAQTSAPSDDRDPRHDDARGAARLADVALALAADAERRVRSARARLGLRTAPHASRAAWRRSPRACRRGLRRRERDDPAQGGGDRALRRAGRVRRARRLRQHARDRGRAGARLIDGRACGDVADRGVGKTRARPRDRRRRESRRGRAGGRGRRRGRRRAAGPGVAARARPVRRPRQRDAAQGRGRRRAGSRHAGRRPGVQRRRAPDRADRGCARGRLPPVRRRPRRASRPGRRVVRALDGGGCAARRDAGRAPPRLCAARCLRSFSRAARGLRRPDAPSCGR